MKTTIEILADLRYMGALSEHELKRLDEKGMIPIPEHLKPLVKLLRCHGREPNAKATHNIIQKEKRDCKKERLGCKDTQG